MGIFFLALDGDKQKRSRDAGCRRFADTLDSDQDGSLGLHQPVPSGMVELI
jgi:hypothetical protein